MVKLNNYIYSDDMPFVPPKAQKHNDANQLRRFSKFSNTVTIRICHQGDKGQEMVYTEQFVRNFLTTSTLLQMSNVMIINQVTPWWEAETLTRQIEEIQAFGIP